MEAGRPTFEAEWPELSGRLTAAMRRRGVSPWLVEDIVQETGFRLFKMWDSVDPDKSPLGLTLTIAKNLLWDETHRRASRELLIDPPEEITNGDVERAGIARMELWRVGKAMKKMSEAQRTVLLAEVGGRAVEAKTPAATKMLRMRARRRLATLMDGASASCLAAFGALRRHAFGFQQALRRGTPVVEGGSASMTMVAIMSAVIVMVPSPGVEALAQDLDPEQTETRLLASTKTVDGWETGVSRPAKDGARKVATTAKKKEHSAPAHELSIGDDNVGGDAVIRSRKTRRPTLFRAPQCYADTSRGDEVTVSCNFVLNDERRDTEFTVRARDLPLMDD